jgi:hypothetical protein
VKNLFRYIIPLILLAGCLWGWPSEAMARRHKPSVPAGTVGDSIVQQVLHYSPLYARIIDEYKCDLYLKGRLKVYKRNRLIRYVPAMFRFDKTKNDYLIESLSEMHYTAPDIYDRKVKAVSSTFPRERSNVADVADYLKMNIYSPTLMNDRLLSPLDPGASKYYTYLLDSIQGEDDDLQYKVRFIPKFKSTQLVVGYMWVSDQVWTIRQLHMAGVYDVVHFRVHLEMGERSTPEEFLPKKVSLDWIFRFMGNHMELKGEADINYHEVKYYSKGEEIRRSQKKHRHDRTESYRLTSDSTSLVTDKARFAELRPRPLSQEEDSLYNDFLAYKRQQELFPPEKGSYAFWGQLGDALISSYRVNLQGVGSVKCSPLLNPVLFSYSHRRGLSYKQKFKYNRYFRSTDRTLRFVPQIGYNFTYKEFYAQVKSEFLYWPQKLGMWELKVGNGNRIYSSAVLDKLKQAWSSDFDFDDAQLGIFKDVYLNLFHSIEPVNGLTVKVGASLHWRRLSKNYSASDFSLSHGDESFFLGTVRKEYNSFAPRLRVEWTPSQYYYMNGRRKMNIGSKLPTFIFDYERGLQGVMNSTGQHERWELDMQQQVQLSALRSIGYRMGGGMFTRHNGMYFVDYANFSRHNLPEGWNDEIGGTFQLLDSHWFNSSTQYWRGNITYEAPFILLRSLKRWTGMVQQERLYGGLLFMPHLNPYVELGYGIGTHVFDFGLFVSSISGRFDTAGVKFTFELFEK